MTDGCVGVHAREEKNKADPELVLTRERGYSGKYRDDLTGQVLRDDLVIEARRKELTYFNSKGVLGQTAHHGGAACDREGCHNGTLGGCK